MCDVGQLYCMLLHKACKFNNNAYREAVKKYGSARCAVLAGVPQRHGGSLFAGSVSGSENELETAASALVKCGAVVVDMNSPHYPEMLGNIYNPPAVLYVRGAIPRGRKIAMVGSRRPTSYGKSATRQIAADLAAGGVIIVSGAAKGIDSEAHQAALSAGAPTVAVLGCGIDISYPRENRQLLDDISRNGAVVSEYPPGTEPRPYFFPMRNRIISGLSDAVIVTEAATRSGALITADFALDQGKDVCAVPGSIFSEHSAGCNRLIKNGARLIDSAADLLEDIQSGLFGSCVKLKPAPSFSEPVEELIYAAIPQTGTTSVDEICMATGHDARTVNIALLNMLLRGVIREESGKRYQKD